MHICVAQDREVLVLLNVGLLHLEDSKAFAWLSVPLSLQSCQERKPTSLHLVLVAVNTGRCETVSPQVLPSLVLVGSAIVTPAQEISIAAKRSSGCIGIAYGEGWTWRVAGLWWACCELAVGRCVVFDSLGESA